MSETWTISVGGRVYGPYSLTQMQAFHAQGRLAAHSLVARSSEEQFHPAQEDTDLSLLFPREADIDKTEQAEAGPSESVPAGDGDAHATPGPARQSFGRSESSAAAGPTHYVIIADMKSSSTAGLEEEIFSLGSAQRFMSQAWVLTSDATLNTIRNQLVQKLGKIDTLFIVDAAHDKAAWFNFGPENDARMRRMWSRPQRWHGVERRAERRA